MMKAFHVSGQYILSLPFDDVVWAEDEAKAREFVKNHLAPQIDCDAPHTLVEVKFERVWTRGDA